MEQIITTWDGLLAKIYGDIKNGKSKEQKDKGKYAYPANDNRWNRKVK